MSCLVSKIQVFPEAAPAGSVPDCFPPGSSHSSYKVQQKEDNTGLLDGGWWLGRGRAGKGVEVGCCSYTHFKARLGLSGRIAVKSLYESDL